jgi:lipopolysaccharide/colanic/teichoic acid biosynthesis glycosyltransferase
MLRFFDILISFFGLLILSPLIAVLFVIGFFDTGSPIFYQTRIGRNKIPFYLLKFRSMYIDTLSVATHLADKNSITKFGKFLRVSKLDELPQLWNVLRGDMSIVGPRPNLFNQIEIIAVRDPLGVYSVRPGITGLAQIRKIDMSKPKLLAETDSIMIKELSVYTYFKYIFLTVIGNGMGDRIKH